MNKKIFLILFIVLIFISCSAGSEKFTILEYGDITYGIYYSKNYSLYVPFTKKQLDTYRKNSKKNNNELVKDLLGEKEYDIVDFEKVNENNLPIIDSNNKVFVVNTSDYLNSENFDKNLLKTILQNLVKQYKERIENYEM